MLDDLREIVQACSLSHAASSPLGDVPEQVVQRLNARHGLLEAADMPDESGSAFWDDEFGGRGERVDEFERDVVGDVQT